GGAVAAGSSIASGGLSAIGGGAVGRGTAVAVAGAGALAVGEVDVVGHHLGTAAVVAVPVLPVPELQPPLGHGHAALGEILADDLRRLPPGHNVNEIRALLAGIAALEVAVHGQGKAGDGHAGLSGPQLRVPDQPPHDDNAVEHRAAPLLALADDNGAHHAGGDDQHAVQLLGESSGDGEGHEDRVNDVFV